LRKSCDFCASIAGLEQMSSHKKATEGKLEEPQDIKHKVPEKQVITNAVKKTTQEVWYFIYVSNVMIFRKPSALTADRPGIHKTMVKSYFN
jgi:hypothetical protein